MYGVLDKFYCMEIMQCMGSLIHSIAWKSCSVWGLDPFYCMEIMQCMGVLDPFYCMEIMQCMGVLDPFYCMEIMQCMGSLIHSIAWKLCSLWGP